jgi:CheY-like chemotaxis protein
MRKLNVLVVEDEPANQEVVEIILASAGHTVVCVSNGQAALDLLAGDHPPFDVVLMDILMPVLDGLATTQRLRASTATGDLPIMCVSARASGSDQAAGKRAGCDMYMTKPYKRRDLLKALHTLLVSKGVIGPDESIGLESETPTP